ncbi:MAG: hypothetical protein B7C24_14275 [Bacteroidetes bacterium 4572_77]|nr:MAG: hypothetical protein B7C24_14275 [Bacteroidetes bacterium 4572_77]
MIVKFEIYKERKLIAKTVDSYNLDILQANNLCNYILDSYTFSTGRKADNVEFRHVENDKSNPAKKITEIGYIQFEEVR